MKDERTASAAWLIAAGFMRAGVWRRDEVSGSVRFDGEAALPREPGVYAYAVAGEVRYVGSAQRGLRRRLRHYEIVPEPLSLKSGLPVDAVAGLEEGLIRSLRPAWNRRGMGVVA
jgi:hypothetical protein